MSKSASARTSATPPGNSPGGSWAFVFMLTVMINLGFTAFVLYMGLPLWSVTVSFAATIVVGVTIRHINTGTGIALPPLRMPGGRALAFGGRVLWHALQAAMAERQLKNADESSSATVVLDGLDVADTDGTSSDMPAESASNRKLAERGRPGRGRGTSGAAKPGGKPKASKPKASKPGGAKRRNRKGAK